MRRIRALALGGVLFVALACPSRAWASLITVDLAGATGTQTLSGTFVDDNDVTLFLFGLSGDATFSAATTSAASGGFDTLLTLLRVTDSGELQLLQENDDPPSGDPDAVLFDAFEQPRFLLGAGNYALALSQTFNYFNAGGGFAFDDSPRYTCDPTVTGLEIEGCAGFYDFFRGVQRTGAYGLTIGIDPVTPEPAPVPEPGTFALLTLGMAGAALRRRRG
jgi:hypothetical protein